VFAPRRDYASNAAPASIAFGDVNGDKKADLVTVSSTAKTVSVLVSGGLVCAGP
jgi:hypothetical protein